MTTKAATAGPLNHLRFQTLPTALQEPFTAACKRGINPRMDCPICEGNRITSEQKYRFDHGTKDFVPSCTEVSCHRCRWTWLVVDKRETAPTDA